jgi:hypothetical protein
VSNGSYVLNHKFQLDPTRMDHAVELIHAAAEYDYQGGPDNAAARTVNNYFDDGCLSDSAAHADVVAFFLIESSAASVACDEQSGVVKIDGPVNWGEIDIALELLAPIAVSGSFIEFKDDEDRFWRVAFENGKYSDQSGVVVYFSEETCPLQEYCVACPFSLICLTGSYPLLKEGRCSKCGGKLVLRKEKVVATITCTCVPGRKFIHD